MRANYVCYESQEKLYSLQSLSSISTGRGQSADLGSFDGVILLTLHPVVQSLFQNRLYLVSLEYILLQITSSLSCVLARLRWMVT